MVRNDIKNSSLLKTKFLIYAFNGRTLKTHFLTTISPFLAMFFMDRRGFVYTNAADIYAFCLAFSSILHCV